VARVAGVSLATASRVVSRSSYPVSDEIRRRVDQAVAELDYSPSALARALATQRSRLLGIIVGDITDPYFSEITRGVEDVARESDYLSIVCNTDREVGTELRYVQMLRDYHAAGVIFAGGGREDDRGRPALERAVRQLEERGTRVVALIPRDFPALAVHIDNRVACADLTRHLIALGHRRIAYVDGPPGLTTSRLRMEGFREALASAGLTPYRIYPGNYDYESGREVAAGIARDVLPDAVLASHDATAAGVLTGLQDFGIRVPDRISVAGMGGLREAGLLGLTTVQFPMRRLGIEAAHLVLAEADVELPTMTVLPHELVARRSTAPRAGTQPITGFVGEEDIP
jgi:LacI family transcriptional regulator